MSKTWSSTRLIKKNRVKNTIYKLLSLKDYTKVTGKYCDERFLNYNGDNLQFKNVKGFCRHKSVVFMY